VIARLVLAILLAVVAVYALAQDLPLPDWPWMAGHNDVAMHLAAFAALTLSLRTTGLNLKQTLMVAALLAMAIEAAQLLIPRRNATIPDLVASLAGIGLGALALLGIRRIITPQDRRPSC
jgi:VanZ family protein